MKTKKSVKRALCMAVVMTVSGCRAPAALGPGGGMSASEGSDSAASSEGSDSAASSEGSDSAASSEGSGESSQSDSGASSEGSGDSSQSESSGSSGEGSSRSESSGSGEEGTSHSESSGSSKGGSSQSESSGSGEEGSSRSESSGSSEEGGASEGSAGTEKADGEASRSRSNNSSQSNNNDVASSVTVAALVVGLGIIIWQAYAAAERRRGVSPKEAGRAAQVYLRARTHQLREDLALGAGPTVEDLAAAARIRREHLGLFGRVLRANRKELLEMAEASTLTPDRALAWLERVGELARAEPQLEEDRRAFLAAPAQEGTATVAH
ncbi:hypothetical protein [Myxococcus sp. NMCA1]|uniref:hypothetical protein n=1 Tax=Myxococcus sp. NMCA1 TaxID=2996785 RepID=UPI0022866894|nr:hypothetical protein [Myxococcus sp. NMCA1]WAM25936.1 hypothetical protein OZ403_36315 [Myxococcus sp. NMCA1]